MKTKHFILLPIKFMRMKDLLASQGKTMTKPFFCGTTFTRREIATKHGIFIALSPFRDVRDEVRIYAHVC